MNSIEGAQVFLSLGTNLGTRILNIKKAVALSRNELTAVTLSRIYETEPLYVTNQGKFLNCVVMGRTQKPPFSLLRALLGIEQDMGRDRSHVPDKGPRIIDIDILLYDQQIITSEELSIPHPGMYDREFVLRPLLDLAPELKDPVSGSPFSDFLGRLENQGVSVYVPDHKK
jgi:2-amino-4-hydroxy-6-hydroxymethyldihydropteridine diphosphokinase